MLCVVVRTEQVSTNTATAEVSKATDAIQSHAKQAEDEYTVPHRFTLSESAP
jgi:hypothetical protein